MELFLCQEKPENIMKAICNKNQNPGNFAGSQGKLLQQSHEKHYVLQSNCVRIFLRECTAVLLCQNNTPCYSANAKDVKTGDDSASCLLQYEA